MKIFNLCFIILSITSQSAFSQDAFERMRQNRTAIDWQRVEEIFKQADQLIYYSPLLLGKSEYQLYSKGRPAELSEYLFTWDAKWLEVPSGEKKLYVRQRHTTTVTIPISNNTFKSYSIRFYPNHWISIDELHNHLKSKYKIRDDGFSDPIITFDNQIAVFKFTIEDNSPIIYIFNIGMDGTFLHK